MMRGTMRLSANYNTEVTVLFALRIEPLTGVIRQNPHSHCVTDQRERQHKIALFTDDILLHFTTLLHTLCP